MTSGYTEFAKPEVTETIISSINSLWFPVLCWGLARMLSLLVSRMFFFLLNPTYPACLCLFISSACCFCLPPPPHSYLGCFQCLFVLSPFLVNSHTWPCVSVLKLHTRLRVFLLRCRSTLDQIISELATSNSPELRGTQVLPAHRCWSGVIGRNQVAFGF